MTHADRRQCEHEPPRYLRDTSEPYWHLRSHDEESTPMCDVRYSNPSTIIRSLRPVNEPICSECANIYLNIYDNDVNLTASLLVSATMLEYVKRTPRIEKTLVDDDQARQVIWNIQNVLGHVAESLIEAGQSQKFTRSIIEQVVRKTMPTEEELAEQERRKEIARKFKEPIRLLLSQIATEIFGESPEDDETPQEDDETPQEDDETPQIAWSAILAPVGVPGFTRQIISPECVVTIREGASLIDEEGNRVGRIDDASIVDGYLVVTGFCCEDVHLSADQPTFDGSPVDQREFGSSDDPTVTFKTLEINAVWLGHALAKSAWDDPKISFIYGSIVEPPDPEKTPAEV